MERQIVLYIAMSLDGYIARRDGRIDWLNGQGDVPDPDYGYDEFYRTVDTVVMGFTTYQQLIHELSPDVWVYENKKCYVASTVWLEPDGRVEFVSGDVTAFIADLKNQPGLDIWLVGGSQLVKPFIEQDLVDQYIITVIPTILGDGIPLFHVGNPEIRLSLTGTRVTDGMVELRYTRRKTATG